MSKDLIQSLRGMPNLTTYTFREKDIPFSSRVLRIMANRYFLNGF